jgi:hypothetical protein
MMLVITTSEVNKTAMFVLLKFVSSIVKIVS